MKMLLKKSTERSGIRNYMNRIHLIIFLSLASFFFACKKEALIVENFEYAPKKMDFEYLKIKSKMVYSDETQNNKATLHIRVQKDSVIWISVQHTIEAFRILILQDSVHMIDRLKKSYSGMSYEDLKKKMGFELNYKFFESLITANVPDVILEEGKKLEKDNMTYLIRKEGYYQFEYFVSSSMRHIEMIRVTEIPSNNALEIDYKNYIKDGDNIYPNEIIAKMTYLSNQKRSKSDISIDHNSFEILSGEEDLSFPFSIPDRYVRN